MFKKKKKNITTSLPKTTTSLRAAQRHLGAFHGSPHGGGIQRLEAHRHPAKAWEGFGEKNGLTHPAKASWSGRQGFLGEKNVGRQGFLVKKTFKKKGFVIARVADS